MNRLVLCSILKSLWVLGRAHKRVINALYLLFAKSYTKVTIPNLKHLDIGKARSETVPCALQRQRQRTVTVMITIKRIQNR